MLASLPNETKEELIASLQSYFQEELDKELNQFDAEFFFDFISDKIGPLFYNQGLYDAQAHIKQRIENISDDLLDMEKQ